uniref:Putative secreted protein n=1 Tax=Anopheles darlingi TaxID=43151 RepID=A0A2M4DD43_ANODA
MSKLLLSSFELRSSVLVSLSEAFLLVAGYQIRNKREDHHTEGKTDKPAGTQNRNIKTRATSDDTPTPNSESLNTTTFGQDK